MNTTPIGTAIAPTLPCRSGAPAANESKRPSSRGRDSHTHIRYLLDTNIAIYVIKNKPVSALELFNKHAGHMAISAITLAELLHGAEKSNAPERSLRVALWSQSSPTLWQHSQRARKAGANHRRKHHGRKT